MMFAFPRTEYSYAAGVNNEIEVNWKYINEDNDFLGCNLFRYDSLSTVCTQVNDSLITSYNHVFSFTDTQSIIDTVDYQYDIEYVFSDTTDLVTDPMFALKRVEFEVQSDEEINVILEFRKNTGYLSEVYISDDNTGWDITAQICINQTDTLSINPYNSLEYLLIYFIDYSIEYPYQGFIKLSMNYLIEIIENSYSEENNIFSGKEEITCLNYPNPFNPITTISFSIPKKSEVNLNIYNVKGQKVKTLLTDNVEEGDYTVIWNGDDESGKIVSSGIYFYNLIVNGKIEAVKKCLMIK